MHTKTLLTNVVGIASIATTFLLATAAHAVLPAVELTPVNNATPTTAQIGQLRSAVTAAVVGADGSLIPVTPQTRLASGNVVEYHGYIINNSPERVKNMKVTIAIPANMELVSKPSPEPVYGSNNGIQYAYMPIKVSVGGMVQDAPLSYYKSLRWDIAGLGLNEVAEVKYQVRVK